MPFSGDFAKLRKAERSLQDMARAGSSSQRRIASAVGKQVRAVLKEEFATGEGADGPWQRTVGGKPALFSKKLPQDFRDRPNGDGVLFTSRIPWLRAHQEGHVFPARSRAANEQFLTFNKNGKLIKNSRALNKKGNVKRGVYQRFAAAHTVGQRVLPPRPIYPAKAEPLAGKWLRAILLGAKAGMERWFARTTEG